MAKGERKNQKGKKADDGQDEQKGDGTVTVRMSKKNGDALVELAVIDGLNSAAEAFEKHFGLRLQHLLISKHKERLKNLEAEAGPLPEGD